MTIDASVYVNAWTKVMRPLDIHILYSCCVDRNWRKNTRKMINVQKQTECIKYADVDELDQ